MFSFNEIHAITISELVIMVAHLTYHHKVESVLSRTFYVVLSTCLKLSTDCQFVQQTSMLEQCYTHYLVTVRGEVYPAVML